jgi:hypothetical protein
MTQISNDLSEGCAPKLYAKAGYSIPNRNTAPRLRLAGQHLKNNDPGYNTALVNIKGGGCPQACPPKLQSWWKL